MAKPKLIVKKSEAVKAQETMKQVPKATPKPKKMTVPDAIKKIQKRTSPKGVKEYEKGAKKALEKKYPGLYKKSK